jgi:DNA (cytosine-5)-methyltransferase 1
LSALRGRSQRKPVLVDLFCKAGGCTKGYQRAGFYVVGVDIEPQPNYCGDEFHQADALTFPLDEADCIHASPPCQAHSSIAKQQRARRPGAYDHPDLVDVTRDRLVAAGVPYVIENVVGAPLLNHVQLCGSSFGLDVRRHRLFECSFPVLAPPCAHHWQKPRFRSLDSRRKAPAATVPVHGDNMGKRSRFLASVVGVHGHLNYAGEFALRQRAMGIDWMDAAELCQAIPPAYTEHIGEYLMADVLRRSAVAA